VKNTRTGGISTNRGARQFIVSELKKLMNKDVSNLLSRDDFKTNKINYLIGEIMRTTILLCTTCRKQRTIRYKISCTSMNEDHGLISRLLRECQIRTTVCAITNVVIRHVFLGEHQIRNK
jgi:hypothetical protein